MTDRSLARIDTTALLMSDGIDGMLKGAQLLIKSGLLPNQVNTPEKAILIMLKGNEYGIGPMASLEGIDVIQGKPVCNPRLMMALVKARYGPAAMIFRGGLSNEKIAVVDVHIPGTDTAERVTYTIEEARQAGLLGKDNWKKYPADMLRARAISRAARSHFPEVIGGLYVSEEIGGQVELEDYIAPAVQTEVATEAEWVPVEDGSEDRVSTETGEIIDGEAREVDEDADPELIAHFSAYLRDLNKITDNDASAIFEDMANPKLKLQRVKGLLLNALKHAIEKCESGVELDELKAEWGKHPAWNQKVQERWDARHKKVTGIPVEELEEVPFD